MWDVHIMFLSYFGADAGEGAERVVCSLEQGHKEWDLDEL